MKILYKNILLEDKSINENIPKHIRENLNTYFFRIEEDTIYLFPNRSENEKIIADWLSVELNLYSKYFELHYEEKDFIRDYKLFLVIENGMIIRKKIYYYETKEERKNIFNDKSKDYYDSYNKLLFGHGFQVFEKIIKNILFGEIDSKEPNTLFISQNKDLMKLINEIDEIRNYCHWNHPIPFGSSPKDIFDSGIDLIIRDDFIFLYFNGTKQYAIKTMNLLEEFIGNEILKTDLLNNQWLNINPDFQFIKWALHNLKWFCIDPKYFYKKLEIIESIETNRIHNFLLDYKINKEIINVIDYFTEEDLKINSEKIASRFNIEYEVEYDRFNIVSFKKSMIFDYLMNEKSIIKLNEVVSQYRIYMDEDQDDSYKENYYNNNDWLKNAAGTSDPEMMNDVYWNLD